MQIVQEYASIHVLQVLDRTPQPVVYQLVSLVTHLMLFVWLYVL